MIRPGYHRTVTRTAALALLSVAFSTGCDGAAGRTADPADGKKVLVEALDAWKAGEPTASLERRSPPIHVSDADWKAGLKLTGYQAGEPRPSGFDLGYPVALELKGPRGGPIKRSVFYVVTTYPEPRVVREDR